MAFVGEDDHYLLRNGKVGSGNWDLIGQDISHIDDGRCKYLHVKLLHASVFWYYAEYYNSYFIYKKYYRVFQ